MTQRLEVKDNLGNRGFLEFEIPVENQTVSAWRMG